jgi:four helix bundle protein
MSYKKFYENTIWQQGANLLEKIYYITKDFPSDEKYALKSQIRRSSNSVIANIAESHGRFFYKDKIRVLYISRGEVEETRSHLLIAKKLNYINNECYEKLEEEYEKLIININSYIIDLNKKNFNNQSKSK